MSRVLIADDHAVVRAGYKQFLEAEAGITAIGETATGNETLDQLRRHEWDLLLMDIHMPDRSGLDILKHVTSGYPKVRVLIMSGLPEAQYARNVLRAGASGYLSKDGSPEELLKAVRTVLVGRRYVSASLAESMAADLESPHDQNQPLHERLSTREFQIFGKLAAGAGVGEIAEELSLSVKTVSTYRSRILEKMNFSSNADMTAYALRNGLIRKQILEKVVPDKIADSSRTTPKKDLQEDGISNPKDGRGPLRKSADSSTKLPLHTDAPKQDRAL